MITKSSSATPWEYRRFSELMASVKSDLHLYDDKNLINDDKYIKVIMKCNEKLGERIHQSKTCKIIVEDYAAPIPEDLWKIENLYGISVNPVNRDYLIGMFGATQLVFHAEDDEVIPAPKERIIKIGSCSMIDDEGKVVISRIDKDYVERKENKVAFPLILSPNVEKECVPYSPCKEWEGQFQVDLNNEEFKFSFKEGEIILSYLGALTDNEGEIMYPFHPLLNDYYEYSIKKKILEDIMLNSDDNVIGKLQYVEQKQSESYYDAYSFIQSAKANQWSKIRKKYEMEFYRKWYKAFN